MDKYTITKVSFFGIIDMPILFVAITAMLIQQVVATTAKVGIPSLIPARWNFNSMQNSFCYTQLSTPLFLFFAWQVVAA